MDENKAAVSVNSEGFDEEIKADESARREALNPYRSFIVQAPAGSGKTSLLVQRYLTLLAHADSPENVLAITFTNKAAGEMRERIVKALNEADEAGGERPKDEFAALTFDLAKKALARSDEKKWNLLENPVRLNIRTIDSLCGRLTRMMPLISRFGCPLEPGDDQKNMYARAASEMMHTLLYDNLPVHAVLREDLKAVLYDFYDNMQSKMEAAVADLLENRAEWVDLLNDDDEADERIKKAKAVYVDAYSAWREAADNKGEDIYEYAALKDRAFNAWFGLEDERDNGVIKGAEKAYGIWRDAVVEQLNIDVKAVSGQSRDGAEWGSWKNISSCLLKKNQDVLRTNSSKDFDEQTNDLIKRLNKASKTKKDRLEKNLVLARDCFGEAVFSDDSRKMLKRTLRLGRFALECLQRVFSEEMSCDYEEISSASIRASHPYIKDGDETSNVDKFLMEDDRIVHILVDEYQDTSRSQFQLLNNLMRGWQPIPCGVCEFRDKCSKRDENLHQECNKEGHTVFCVGDPMQSIYRFRGADVSVYTHTQNSGFDYYKKKRDDRLSVLKPAELGLKKNFRSRHELVKELGKPIFEGIFPMEPEKGDIDIGVIKFEPSVAAASWEGAEEIGKRNIEVKPILSDKAFKEVFGESYTYKAGAYEADLIVDEIKKIRENEKDSSIAVLLESKVLGTEILRRLQSLEKPIPVAQKEVCSLDKAEPVPLLTAMTNVFLNVLERRFWFALLRSKLVGLTLKEAALLMERVLKVEKDGYNPPEDFWASLGLLANSDKTVKDLKRNGMTEGGLEACRRLYLAYKQAFKTRRSMGLADSIRGLWMRLGGPAVCSREEAANAEQFFEYLKRFDKRGEWPNAKTLEEGLSRLFAESSIEEGNPVQFLTIHGAKGLEFDYVFLPGLASKKPRNWELKLINAASFSIKKAADEAADEKKLLSPIMTKEDGSKLPDSYILESVKKLSKEGENHERVRLFYVAATRAKRRVYMYVHLDPKIEKRKLIGFKLHNSNKMLNNALWRIIAKSYTKCLKEIEKTPDTFDWNSDRDKIEYLKSWQRSTNDASAAAKSADGASAAQNKKLTVQRLSLDWPEKVSEAKAAEAEIWKELWNEKAAETVEDGHADKENSRNGQKSEAKKALGTLVHEMLEKLADLAAEDADYRNADGELRFEKFSEQILKKLIEETEIKGSFPDKRLEWIRNNALQCLHKVLNSEKGRWILKPRKGAGAEQEFQCVAERLEEIEKTEAELQGRYAKRIIDRSFFENGVFWIVDYKTGKPGAKKSAQEFYAVKKDSYQKQLLGYTEIMRKLLGDNVKIKAALYFPFLADKGGEWREGWCEFDFNGDFA